MIAEQQIKAVAEAIEREALAMAKENFSPDLARPKSERFAKAAIAAMQVRENAAHEEAKALVGELVEYIESTHGDGWRPTVLLTKATKWLEGK